MLVCKTVFLNVLKLQKSTHVFSQALILNSGLFSGSLLNALVYCPMFVYLALLKASLKGLESFSFLLPFLIVHYYMERLIVNYIYLERLVVYRGRTMSATGYTRELARIKATQKAWEYRKYGRPIKKPEPMSFNEWLRAGMEHYKTEYGFSFELVTPGLMRIKRPGQGSLLRTAASFREEYKNEYLSKF